MHCAHTWPEALAIYAQCMRSQQRPLCSRGLRGGPCFELVESSKAQPCVVQEQGRIPWAGKRASALAALSQEMGPFLVLLMSAASAERLLCQYVVWLDDSKLVPVPLCC